MKRYLISFFILLAMGGLVRAEPITFEATVNAPKLSLDEVLQLTLTVTGVNKQLDPINLPVLDGFSAKYLGPSTSVSIVNGDYHSERSFIYDLFPNKAGHFEIPPISATIEGQTYTTKPIDVDVYATTAQAQSAAGPSDQNQAPANIDNDILVNASVPDTNVYVGQQVPLTIILLYKDVPLRDVQMPQFDKTGISADDFDKPQQGTEVINGAKYDGVQFKTNIYPRQLGAITIGPVVIQGNILYKTGQKNPFAQANDIFDSNVFNNFFDTYATRPVSKSTQPFQLHVAPLPEDGRPADFSGAVGQFNFQASVTPLSVKAGDPMTLKMQISGNGDMKSVKMPEFQDPGFKSYPPQTKDNGNEKTAEIVIIPKSADIKLVPALHFSYFDPASKAYKTVTQGPFDIQVAAPSPETQFKAVGFADISKDTAAQASGQFSWSKIFNRINTLARKLAASIWFWTGLGLVLAAGGSFFVWRRFQWRLAHDTAFARRLKAVREAKQALAGADSFIASGRTKDLYALVGKVLRDYLANKWHQSSPALSLEGITAHLKEAGLEGTLVEEVRTLLEQSDLVCFAGADRNAAQMREDLSQVTALIGKLEKSLK